MILAGHETTATTLFWSFYLLALDPASQDQLAAEVQAAIVNGALDLERLNLPVRWSMRRFGSIRRCPDCACPAGPDTVAGRPVKNKDVILIAPWLLPPHEKLWRDRTRSSVAFHAGAPATRSFRLSAVRRRRAASASVRISRWWKPHWRSPRSSCAFRIELLDREPVIPVGV